MRVDLFDQIETFKQDSVMFKIEFMQNSEIIARYDEILCQKCSIQRLATECNEI